ncbi:tryptophan synthase subunit alpha [Francisella philomiragia]|uniref:Tryptophan synthase alpha chain n=1 Tax=Francisella philomiragia TaxID=28110 RepID=A0AAW3D8Z2_9GAMM|nr:tryptophan synthase subunit alpha [Francisella philomiragia]KFJ41898.1 tryptophan synthase, alpha subunit [Francisella philomiragia]MBK2254074.1 tryptophan synthase subunit alpha [Francisella philomiragia]MBK2272386.1 tryptophan synthase subunit alpha [Francisella philomiragia]MBK2276228.1 tryptophan synthase subunit alpha [Francisella philomiragia]MBK2280175.1 tryptophan synthase subunit alpha [Francisella philomiragia]
MDRYTTLFASLEKRNEGAFIPFVTIGDPNKELSLEIIDTLVSSGADALELGIPFSDPLADGPIIQEANIRALESGVTPKDCFDILTKIRVKYPHIPIGLLLYANLVYANGIENFYQKCLAAGVDSILIADVPAHESKEFRDIAKRVGISQIFIAPPDANETTLKQISELGSGYTYLLSRVGVTGAETAANMPVEDVLAKLREYNAPKPILGFGISKPEQVQQAIKAGAAGAISGSATVKIIQNNLSNKETMLSELECFVKEMKAATKNN